MDRKEIEILFEENKLVAKEILEYTKLIFLILSIFLVFTGTAFTLGTSGNIEAWLALQILTPFFLVMLTTLEKENKLNSVCMIYNEKRINFIFKKSLLYWQSFIGSGYLYEKTKFNRVKYLINPIMISFFLFAVYMVPVLKLSNIIKGNWQIYNIFIYKNNAYIVISIFAYLVISILLLNNRKIAINKIIALIQKIKTDSFFE